jgi:hypothetical protein
MGVLAVLAVLAVAVHSGDRSDARDVEQSATLLTSGHEAFVSACHAVPCLKRSNRSLHSFVRLQLLFFSSSIEVMCLRAAEEAQWPLREFSDAGES